MFVSALPGCGANTAIARLHATADHDDILDIANSSFHKSSADFFERPPRSAATSPLRPMSSLLLCPDAELSGQGKRLGEFAAPRRSARGRGLDGFHPWLYAKGLALSGRYLAGRYLGRDPP